MAYIEKLYFYPDGANPVIAQTQMRDIVIGGLSITVGMGIFPKEPRGQVNPAQIELNPAIGLLENGWIKTGTEQDVIQAGAPVRADFVLKGSGKFFDRLIAAWVDIDNDNPPLRFNLPTPQAALLNTRKGIREQRYPFLNVDGGASLRLEPDSKGNHYFYLFPNSTNMRRVSLGLFID